MVTWPGEHTGATAREGDVGGVLVDVGRKIQGERVTAGGGVKGFRGRSSRRLGQEEDVRKWLVRLSRMINRKKKEERD